LYASTTYKGKSHFRGLRFADLFGWFGWFGWFGQLIGELGNWEIRELGN